MIIVIVIEHQLCVEQIMLTLFDRLAWPVHVVKVNKTQGSVGGHIVRKNSVAAK
jgi:hypothetical protein